MAMTPRLLIYEESLRRKVSPGRLNLDHFTEIINTVTIIHQIYGTKMYLKFNLKYSNSAPVLEYIVFIYAFFTYFTVGPS